MPLAPPSVLIFLKCPRPGFVKTRLAKSLGDEEACQVYQKLVSHTLKQIPADWPLRIHFAPADAIVEMTDWLGSEHTFVPQPDGDLGHRLDVACQQAFAEENTSGVILLGGDCPGLNTSHLLECAELLAEKKPVIGPSEDGGYWLLGLPSPDSRLFKNIPWSTSEVLPKTLALFAEKKQTPTQLDTLFDVDEEETYQKALTQNLLD